MSTAAAIAIAPLGAVAEGETRLRGATAADAVGIHQLIAAHLAEGHLLPRSYSEIAVHAHRFVVGSLEDQILACAELAPLSRNVSEIRSLVVAEKARGHGLGRGMLDELVARATAAGFEKLCAFTHAPAFFVHRGFSMVPHVWLQEKIVTDCHSCPRFRHCGQHAVLRELRRPNQAFVPLAALHG